MPQQATVSITFENVGIAIAKAGQDDRSVLVHDCGIDYVIGKARSSIMLIVNRVRGYATHDKIYEGNILYA